MQNQAIVPPVVILAGGTGTRMGGIDKCLLSLGQTTVLERTVQTLLQQSNQVLLNANGDPTRFSDFNIPVIADSNYDAVGPLGGIYTALEKLKTNNAYVVTVAGDCPFLPNDLCQRLIGALKEGTEIVYCSSKQRDHFVNALWSVEILAKLQNFLDSGQRSVGRFIKTLSYTSVSFDDYVRDPFFNINHHEQFEQAQKLLNGS